MDKKILIVVPSRSRPELMRNLLWSWKNTTSEKSDILVFLDTDDLEMFNYPFLDHIIGVREELNYKNNRLVNLAVSRGYDIVGCLSDDFIFHTKGWEDEIIGWQKENRGICYGNDLLQGASLPTAPFIHTSIIKSLGYAAPPELIHYFIDNYWMELGMRLDKIKYLPEILIEHKHWSAGKSEKDAVYSESEKVFEQDRNTWDKYRITKLADDVQKVQLYQAENQVN